MYICTYWNSKCWLEDNVAKLLEEFATAKQKKDDLQQQFEADPWPCHHWLLQASFPCHVFHEFSWGFM